MKKAVLSASLLLLLSAAFVITVSAQELNEDYPKKWGTLNSNGSVFRTV